MNKGIRIARLFGIDIKIDWSWLLILLLIVWNLTSAFSQAHPEWEMLFSVGMGLIASILFFLSVLLHELAHSLVAKSQGIPVSDITLFLFGGVSNIREEPKPPGSEFAMAVMGHVASLVIGFPLLVLSGIGLRVENLRDLQIMQFLEELGAFRTIMVWIGSVNVILGLFNLVPGFPLDGGRVLHSIIWRMTGNLRKATQWASYIGQAIAWIMIMAGMAMIFGIRIPFFGQGLIDGVWLILIGWFLNNAAIHTLLNGGNVLMLKKEEVPGKADAAAILRY